MSVKQDAGINEPMRELKVSVYVGVLLVLYVKHTHLCKFKCLEKPDVVNIKCYI